MSLVHSCTPTTIPVGASADCVVEAQNLSAVPAQTSLSVQGPNNGQLTIENVSAPGVTSGNGFTWNGTLTPALPPTIDSLQVPGGSPAGYLPLSAFGIAPVGGIGDETIANFAVPAFQFGREAYTRIGMTSNGYAVVGGSTSADVAFVPQTCPNPTRPNNVLAPYWNKLEPSRWWGASHRHPDWRGDHVARPRLGEGADLRDDDPEVVPDLDSARSGGRVRLVHVGPTAEMGASPRPAEHGRREPRWNERQEPQLGSRPATGT